MSILSINSHVAYGHVGNAAATFALQRLGHEVWPLQTVLFSNHPGHGDFRGQAVAVPLMSELLAGLARRGAHGACEAVLSGYLGDEAQGEVVRQAVALVRGDEGRALYCCDPVIGDEEKGFYVAAGIASFIKAELAPLADVITPNRFELEYLADCRITNLEQAIAACERLRVSGPRVVVCTSLSDSADPDTIATLAVAEGGTWLARTPMLRGAPHGTGDLFAAVFLGRYLEGREVSAALSHAVSATFAVVSASLEAGTDELDLIAAQDELVAPSRTFAAEAVG